MDRDMDRNAIQELCSLSKLNLSEEQMAKAEEQITRLLGYFDMLQAVSTDEVEASPYPMAIPQRLREDEVEPTLSQETVLENAPARRAGSFLVPRVVEG